MAQNDNIDKAEEASSAAPAQDPQLESPPVYTPRATVPGTPIHPPPTEGTQTTEHVVPQKVHVPTGPFSTNLTQIGPDPVNVICPRCHHGVCTSTKSRAGVHAG
jgi:hypothetical protein